MCRTIALLVLAVAAMAVAAADPSAKMKAKMQGSWEAETILDGMGKDPVAEVTLSVHGDWFTAAEHGNTHPAIISVDASRSPATFEAKGLDGTIKGLIEVAGDHLRIAFAKNGEAATSFEPAVGRIVMTYRRATPATRPAATRP